MTYVNPNPNPCDWEWGCPPQHADPHVVYRLFDAEGALLYIGMTSDMETRLRGHLLPTSTQHGADVIRARYASHTVEDHPGYHSAHDAEVAAIYAEMPELNRQHNAQRWQWSGGIRKWVPRTEAAA